MESMIFVQGWYELTRLRTCTLRDINNVNNLKRIAPKNGTAK